jgi:hypothetical protein
VLVTTKAGAATIVGLVSIGLIGFEILGILDTLLASLVGF